MAIKRLAERLALVCVALLGAASSCSDVDSLLDSASDLAKEGSEAVRDAVEDVLDSGSGGRPTGGSSHDAVTGDILTGPSTFIASEVVEPSGGTITVSKPGDALDGMVIQVPAGSYSGATQFSVSSAPISGNTFGKYVTPVTPLIIIENGGDYSEEFMTVRIPVDVPADHFAMAFFYDETAGTLEGIPFSGLEQDSITVVTRHFSKLLVSIISNTLLDDMLKTDIDSHFRPGIDDWQFTNYGSYIAKGGHCAGQSLTALWYFCEQPDGQDLTLNGRYDRNGKQPMTPDLWEDDSHGYRLASTVQEDINWSSFENELMTSLAGVNDRLTFQAFAYAMQLTGEPQEVGIFSSAGGGHDMICYRVYKNSLYIADPNYPGNTDRRIKYANERFVPYESGANAAEIAAGNSTTYETIEYCAKSASVDWNKIAQRWNEFKAGTIGNDVFPRYDLVVVKDDGKIEPLVDGYASEQKKIDISEAAGIPNGGSISVFREGVPLNWDANGKIELVEGNNPLGILVQGDVDSSAHTSMMKYIDFKYFNVVYGREEAAPSSIPYITLFCEGSPGNAYDSWREERNYNAPSAWFHFNSDASYVPITWNGLNFSGSVALQPHSDATGSGMVTVSGSLSAAPGPNQPALLTVNYTQTYDAVSYDWHETGSTSYTITNIPLDCNAFAFTPGHELRSQYLESSGAAMGKYLTSFECRMDTTWLGEEPNHLFPDEHWTYSDTTCSAPTGVPGETQAEFTIILKPPEA
jgi:hypothetical protein